MGDGFTHIGRQQAPYKILLRQRQAPGDVLVATACIESLKRQHQEQYRITVDTTCNAIFENNPHVEDIPFNECHMVELQYPLINSCGSRPVHFLQGFVEDLSRKLGIRLHLDTNHPSLYLSESEKVPPDLPTPYALVNSGFKSDFTCKGAGSLTYQQIVDRFKGRINFVQVGENNPSHAHKRLDGVIDMVGKTTTRELIRLAYHSACGVGGVSFLHHIYASFKKPFVCYLGGREEASWEGYNTAVMLSTLGVLPCCRERACWKSRTVPLRDGSKEDLSLCVLPVVHGDEVVPGCMATLGSHSAILAIETMLMSGVITS